MRGGYLLAGLAAVAALALPNCSLRPLSATVIVRVGSAGLRPNPELTEMTRFAIVISNGPANTLSGSDVQGRGLTCLKLNGSVTFPRTLAQLYAGVSIAIPLGSYHIAIVGYSDTTGMPTTVASMFSGSAGLKSFLIAEGDFNTTTTQRVELTSTYVKATATDLIASCPIPGAGTLQTLTVINGLLNWTRKTTSGWVSSEPIPSQTLKKTGFHVDADGTAHMSYSRTAPAFEIRYAENSSGTFLHSLVSTHFSEVPTAVSRDASGKLFVIWRDMLVDTQVIANQKLTGGTFSSGDIVLTTSAPVVDLRLVGSPTANRLLGIAKIGLATTPLHLFMRTELGTWGDLGVLVAAGGTACDTAIGAFTAVADSAGFFHIFYECQNAVQGIRMGYATDQVGSFQSYNLSPGPLVANVSQIAADIDPAGNIHVAYTSMSGLNYFKGPSNSIAFGPDSTVYSGTDPTLAVTFKALSETSVVGLIGTGGASKLLQTISNVNGWQVDETLDSTALAYELPHRLF